MPECRSAASLLQICLEAVGGKMDFWCKDFADNFQVMKGFKHLIGPFDDICSDVCMMLLRHLMEQKNLKRPFLYSLMHHSLVDLNLSGCPLLVDDDVINVALLRCKGLKSINLKGCTKVKERTLVALAEAYPNLVSLNLHGTKCAHKAARAVFKNCTKVKNLILSFCTLLDDDDLSVLINSVKNKGTHKNLREFGIFCTKVSCRGLFLVLRSLPWVTVLEHDRLVQCLELLQAMQGGCKVGQDKTLKLRSLRIFEYQYSSSRMVLRNSFRQCPQLVKVMIYGVDDYLNSCFCEMGNLAMLQDLNIYCDGDCEVDFHYLLQALKKIGSNLQQLVLDDIDGLNPLEIALLCPNLIELELKIKNPEINPHSQFNVLDKARPSPENLLPKLKKVTLRGHGPKTEDITLPGLTRFLSACCAVEKLELGLLEELTDTVLQDVLKFNDMSHLTSFKVSCCRYVTNDSLGELILSPTNKLRLVNIMYCRNITHTHYSNWLATAKEKNYNIEISFCADFRFSL